MKEMVADAIVVGAGPAGSAAAIALSRSGRRVLLLDRAAFPREKVCGDLIGAGGLAWARRLGVTEAELSPYAPLRGVLVTQRDGALDLTPASATGRAFLTGTDARVIPRTVFDAALVRAAQRIGAELRQVTVRDVGPWSADGRLVFGSTRDGPVALRARAVIVAGGYGCRLPRERAPAARRMMPEPPRGIALRGYFSNVTAPPHRMAICLDERLLPGYGWLFPLPGGGANVGVGVLARAGARTMHLDQLYRRFTREPSSPAAQWLQDASEDGPPRAWPLDLGPRRRRLTADGLLVAGEAAALVGPLTGAGIAFALASGALAGGTLADALTRGDLRAAALRPYARSIGQRFAPWLAAEAVAQRWLSDPARLRRFLRAVRPLPLTPTLGARLLLHLG